MRKIRNGRPPSYPLQGWCNTTHPRNIRFRVNDTMIVRIIDAHANKRVKTTAKRSKIVRMLMHYAIEIYVRETGCVFSIGLYENKTNTITVQTPDKIISLSRKTKYKDNTYGAVSEADAQTVAQRIQQLRRKKALLLTTSLNPDHLKLLKTMMKRCHPHPRMSNTWVFLPTRSHPYKKIPFVHNTLVRHKQPLTQKQRKAYECQQFAREFVHRPKVLMKIYE